MRPVVILGPCADLARMLLVDEMPDRFAFPCKFHYRLIYVWPCVYMAVYVWICMYAYVCMDMYVWICMYGYF